MPDGSLLGLLEGEARRLGFSEVGVTSAAPFTAEGERAQRAIAEGRMDGMPWYTPERVAAATDLRARHPWARSIVSLAWPYRPARPRERRDGELRGRIAAYACLGEDGSTAADYHALLATKCRALIAFLREREPEVRAKHFVDHGWAMDRAVAERAGVGFSGKNTTLITRGAGSYVLLAELLLSIELPETAASKKACGSCCRACLPACPTGALLQPGVIDSPRCISYLTIEHRGPIPEQLRPLIGDWVFGCDLCQEACPINQRLAPPPLPEAGASTARGPVPFPDLVECLLMAQEEFDRRFHATALRRTGRAGLARNCAIALGNLGEVSAVPALERARDHDEDPVVRDAAGWALGRIAARA